jgi:hypothetical protein
VLKKAQVRKDMTDYNRRPRYVKRTKDDIIGVGTWNVQTLLTKRGHKPQQPVAQPLIYAHAAVKRTASPQRRHEERKARTLTKREHEPQQPVAQPQTYAQVAVKRTANSERQQVSIIYSQRNL